MEWGAEGARMKRMTIVGYAGAALLAASLFGAGQEKERRVNDRGWNPLTPEEARVIVHKGTEAPFTGRYAATRDAGTYICRQCGAALYRAEDKFDSGCGWPSFDDEVPGAVTRVPDADGKRTEIQCAVCGGHLGHLFLGERLTARNTRHCVNSISLEFVPLAVGTNRFGRAIFAGGCFWGVDFLFQQAPGVIRTTVGYTGGRTGSPTYEAVCREATGHAEAVEVTFDPRQTSFKALAKLFFEIHDPTQVDRQGPDVGDQYRSAIFYMDREQKEAAEQWIAELRRKGFDVATRLEPAGPFWPAEEKHQNYYRKTGQTPYCHRRTPRL